MKVGIDARFLLRPQRGMPHYVTALCRHVPALRPSWRFILFINQRYEHNEEPDAYAQRLEAVGAAPNVELVNMDDDAEMWWEQYLLPRAARAHAVDLLHLPGNRTCLSAGVPVIPTVHDLMELSYMTRQQLAPAHSSLRTRAYFWRRRAYVWATYQVGFRRAPRIITVSESSKRELVEDLGIRAERVDVIHHGIEPHFRPSNGARRFSLDDRTHCLMFGGESYQKNPEGALRAWAAVPESLRRRFPLRIVGFKGRASSPLLRTLAELGLADEVTVSGWLDLELLVCSLQEAAVLLFLSRREGFGFPIIEAMACGTPVVASDDAALQEIAGGAAATVAADDAPGAAAAITRLLSSQEVWSRAVEKGLRRAGFFSWAKSAEKHAQVYEDLASGRSSASSPNPGRREDHT